MHSNKSYRSAISLYVYQKPTGGGIAMSSSIICWLGPEPVVLCELVLWKTIPHSAELFQSPGNPGERQQKAAAGDDRGQKARE